MRRAYNNVQQLLKEKEAMQDTPEKQLSTVYILIFTSEELKIIETSF